jgi:hypothetical protein
MAPLSRENRLPEQEDLPDGYKPAARVPAVLAADNRQTIYGITAVGGLKALKKAYKLWRAYIEANPGSYLLVELGTKMYNHREWGETWEPLLTAVGWLHADGTRVDLNERVIQPSTSGTLPSKEAGRSSDVRDEIAF